MADSWDSDKMLEVFVHDYLVKKNLPDLAAAFAAAIDVGESPLPIDDTYCFLADWWVVFWEKYNAIYRGGPRDRESSPAQPEMDYEQRNIFTTLPMPDTMTQQRTGRFSMGFDVETTMLRQLGGNSFAQPGGSSFAQPGGSSFAQPGGSSFAQPAGSCFAQQGGSSFPQPEGTSFPQPGGNSFGLQGGSSFPQPGGSSFPLRCGNSFGQPGGSSFPQAGGNSFWQTGRSAFGQQGGNYFPSTRYGEPRFAASEFNLGPNLQLIFDNDRMGSSWSSSSLTSSSHQQYPPSNAQHQDGNGRDNNRSVSFGRSNAMDSNLYGATQEGLTSLPMMEKTSNSLPPSDLPLTGYDRSPSQPDYPILNSLQPLPNQQQQFETSSSDGHLNLLPSLMETNKEKQIAPFHGSNNTFGSMMQTPISRINMPETELLELEQQATTKHMTAVAAQTVEQNLGTPVTQEEDRENEELMQDNLQEVPISEQSGRKRKSLASQEDEANASDAKLGKSSEDNMNLFSSPDDDNTKIIRASFANRQRHPATSSIDEQNEGFSFKEVASLQASNSELLSCHFSSDGKFLASVGQEKKVLLWNTNTLDFVYTVERHTQPITDVRFKPNSTVFATSSFDGIVQIWDANKPNDSLLQLVGHAENVTSLDFNPRKVEILCSCDSNNEIRLWNINQRSCVKVFRGANRQVKFQPRLGNLLAAACRNRILLFDVETSKIRSILEGHENEVRSICWDASGKYIASVSEDSARVWSVTSGGNCIHELESNGNDFETCTFHPGYSQLLVIGSYQSLDLWNPTDSNKMLTVVARNSMVSSLADSPRKEIIASTSHKGCVKLWK